MPILEYFCQDCDETYEVLIVHSRLMGEDTCPRCKKEGDKVMSVNARMNFQWIQATWGTKPK